MSNIRREPTTEEEIIKCANDSLYYYNNYKRLENEPVLTREEFAERVREFKEARDKKYSQEELQAIRDKKAEMMFKDRPDVIDTISGVVAKEVAPLKNKIENVKAKKEKKKLSTRIKNRLAKKSRKNNRKK